LLDERNDACDEASGSLMESQDIVQSNLAERFQHPYYLPETFQFSFPISLRVFLNLKLKANQAISFGCADTIKGFLKEVQYQPNGDGGLAQFKVTRAYEP
jgi:hypothetical protein